MRVKTSARETPLDTNTLDKPFHGSFQVARKTTSNQAITGSREASPVNFAPFRQTESSSEEALDANVSGNVNDGKECGSILSVSMSSCETILGELPYLTELD